MDDGRFEAIIEQLRVDGGRVTSARRAVVRALLEADSHHVTAADVLARVRALEPDFQESTVYRTLDRLMELGVITHAHMGHGPTVYHLTEPAHRHLHLLCNSCGSVIELPPAVLAATMRKVDRDFGFAVDADHFALTGLCAKCRPR